MKSSPEVSAIGTESLFLIAKATVWLLEQSVYTHGSRVSSFVGLGLWLASQASRVYTTWCAIVSSSTLATPSRVYSTPRLGMASRVYSISLVGTTNEFWLTNDWLITNVHVHSTKQSTRYRPVHCCRRHFYNAVAADCQVSAHRRRCRHLCRPPWWRGCTKQFSVAMCATASKTQYLSAVCMLVSYLGKTGLISLAV